MIADQDMDSSTGRRGLALEAHQQIHSVTRARTAIEQITDDHKVRVATCPNQVLVEHIDVAQRLDHCVVCAVHIRYRNYPADAINGAVIR